MDTYNQFICGNDGDALEIRNDATSGVYQPAQWLIDWATGGKNDAGVAVNGYTALTHCPLWQGVNIIAGDFGQTPVRLLRNDFDEQKKHPSWNLLRVSPNQLQTPSVWKETMMQWALIWGNGVSWIRRQGSRPVELIPLRPDCLWHQVMAFEDQEILLYHYKSPYPAGAGGKMYTFFPDDVVHLQGITGDGVWGYPLWQIARNTIGHGLALEKHGNKQFSNGARPSGVLQHPAKLSPDARAELRKDWNAIHGGPDNAGKIAILWEGMQFQAMSNTNVEADWIEAKRMGVYEAASLLNLPPHKLGALQDSSVRANLEEQNADYVNRTLSRWYTRADEEYRRKLLTTKEWQSDEFEFKHDVDSFLKGDLDTLTTVADRCVKATLMNPNEGRHMLGLPPYKGGEKYGSPAINPSAANENSPSSAGKTPKTAPNKPQNVENAHRDMLFDQLLAVLENESSRLRHAASSARLFVQWLDEFYLGNGGDIAPKFVSIANSIMGKSVSACTSIGMNVDKSLALEKYAKHRHSVLLDACSDVTKPELPAAIEKLINSEPELVAQGILATALGGPSWESE
jgi:HK97 family phage portal protein